MKREDGKNVIKALLENYGDSAVVQGPNIWIVNQEKSPLVQLELTPFWSGLNVSFIRAFEKGQGRHALGIICELADQFNCKLSLDVDGRFGKHETTLRDQKKFLRAFYKEFGFKSQKGAVDHMTREPSNLLENTQGFNAGERGVAEGLIKEDPSTSKSTPKSKPVVLSKAF